MNPVWDDDAADELADIWVAATPEERDVIERAVLRVNRELVENPEIGETRIGDSRVHFSSPLTVWYSIDPDLRVPLVFGVRLHRTKR